MVKPVIILDISGVVQFEIRRRRSLISAQGWSTSDNPGYRIQDTLNPERVRQLTNPYRVAIHRRYKPRVLAPLGPWAEIGERLRRFQTEPVPIFPDGADQLRIPELKRPTFYKGLDK